MARDPAQVQNVRLPDCQGRYRIMRAADILYDPRLRLQILHGGLIPTEAIDEWSLNFVRDRYPKDNFKAPFNPRYCDQEACVLSNSFSRNFMHWTTEQLAKVILLEDNGFTGTYVLS